MGMAARTMKKRQIKIKIGLTPILRQRELFSMEIPPLERTESAEKNYFFNVCLAKPLYLETDNDFKSSTTISK
jgi:hypothetical protein